MADQRRLWERRLDQLDAYLAALASEKRAKRRQNR
jgi:hypothetical protein